MTETLLEEFEPYVDSWTLIPGDGGRFEIEVNGKLIFSKQATHQHAEIDDIRDLLREVLASLNSAGQV
jgi:selenoprotein W-related protein